MLPVRWTWPVVAVVAGVVLFFTFGADQTDDAARRRPVYKTVFVPATLLPAKTPNEPEVEADGAALAAAIDRAIAALVAQGFEVVEVVPMIRGVYRWAVDQPVQRSASASALGYGYGYSVTSGVNVVARKDAE